MAEWPLVEDEDGAPYPEEVQEHFRQAFEEVVDARLAMAKLELAETFLLAEALATGLDAVESTVRRARDLGETVTKRIEQRRGVHE